MTLLWILVMITLGYGVSTVLARALPAVLNSAGFVARNYRGRMIPKGMGIAIPLAAVVPLGALAWGGAPASLISLWIAMLFGMGFLGLFDDAAGDRTHGGFVQHFRSLLSGRPTTGALKALYGGALALYAGWTLGGGLFVVIVGAAVIALATNAVNLLDVRPGRALKGGALLASAGVVGFLLIIEPASWHHFHLAAGGATFGASMALWHGDTKGRFMLGDSGSNVLGVAAGMIIAITPLGWQMMWLGILVLLHAYAEKHSITSLIDRVELLNRLDQWGR